MRTLWPRIFKVFPRPWRILRVNKGALRIESSDGRAVAYIYPRHNDVWNFKMPSDGEALDIVRALAKLSKPRRRMRPSYWIPKAKRPRRWRAGRE